MSKKILNKKSIVFLKGYGNPGIAVPEKDTWGMIVALIFITVITGQKWRGRSNFLSKFVY